MEFYAASRARPDVQQLQQTLQISNLSDICASIDTVMEDDGTHGRIYCLWGEFAISRETVRNGIRFSLNSCPHSLAWTITRDDDALPLRVHCTITTQQPDPDFAESIQQFVDDWAAGLDRTFPHA